MVNWSHVSYALRVLSTQNNALYVGRGGAMVVSMPFDRRVVGSNSSIAARYGPWASPSLAVACTALACKLRHSVTCCGIERFRKVHALRRAIEIDKYNIIQYNSILSVLKFLYACMHDHTHGTYNVHSYLYTNHA